MKKITSLTQIEYIIKNQLIIFKEDGSSAISAGDLLNMTLSEVLYSILDNYFFED